MMSCKCGNRLLIKSGIRKNKYSDKQVYKCKKCKKFLTEDNGFSSSSHSDEVIKKCLNLFCTGISLDKISNRIQEEYKHKISKSTISRWVNKVKGGKWEK